MLGMRARAIARWEFRRFAKAKDLVIGMVTFALIFGAGSLFGEFAGRKLDQRRTIAVVQPERLGVTGTMETLDLELVPHEGSVATLDSLLLDEEIDAGLLPLGEDGWELRVRRERTWTGRVQTQLTALAQQVRIARLDLDPEVLEAISAPPRLTTTIVDPPEGMASKASPLSTILVVALMMMGLFVGFSYVFVAITGEKTQRVTESLLSAVSPQEWIDGKILGLTGVVLVNLTSTVLGYVLWKLVAAFVFGEDLGFPEGIAWSTLPMGGAFAFLGFFFWFTCFAMLAATIDDPNTSQRSSFMFLPFLPISAVFTGLDSADALWMRVMSIVPGLSPIAMPVRLLRGEPAGWEIALSLALLVAGAWWFRRAAGRMFGTSMLMTGKEPSLREVFRWLKESS